MKMRIAVLASIALAVLVGLTPPARSADGDITFGTQQSDITTNEAKYQEYREIPQGGFIDTYLWRWSKDRWWIHTWGANALREDQHAGLQAGWGNKVKLDVDYTQIPHNFSFLARTPYYEVSPGVFRLPDSLQAINQKNANNFAPYMNDYIKNAQNLNLGFRTDAAKSQLKAELAPGLLATAKVTTRERNGDKAYAASFGFSNTVEVPEPIDQQMLDADGAITYEKSHGTTQFNVRASGGYSKFTNDVSTLYVDNPRVLRDGTAGASMAAIDLYPDNKVLRGGLEVGVRMPHRTLWTASATLSHMTQNDPWLPFTTNSTLLDSMKTLPGTSTDAEATQLNVTSRITRELMDRLNGSAKFFLNKFTNNTPAYEFAGFSPYDQTFERGAIVNDTPYNQTTGFGGELSYQLKKYGSVTGSLDWTKQDHDAREVDVDKELLLGVKAKLHPASAWSVDLNAQTGHRKPDDYSIDDYISDNGTFNEQPDLRRFDIADRKSTILGAGVGYAVGEVADLGLSYSLEKYVYNNDGGDGTAADTMLGLQDEHHHGITATGTLHVSERLDVNLTWGFEQDSTFQRSREGAGAAIVASDTVDWSAHIQNRDIFWTMGADYELVPGKLSCSGTFEFYRDLGRYHFTNFKNTAQDVPDTFDRRYDILLEMKYKVAHDFDLGARYGYEQYNVTDFALQGVPLLFPVTGSTTAIFLGDGLNSYAAHRMSLFATMRF